MPGKLWRAKSGGTSSVYHCKALAELFSVTIFGHLAQPRRQLHGQSKTTCSISLDYGNHY
jgi:hypothetical protein